ncbi:hypothetical protein CP02DC14_1462, partial [Chlamydia psittaci 02DC14]
MDPILAGLDLSASFEYGLIRSKPISAGVVWFEPVKTCSS